jgi:tetratricopeptide (TPR) repeat protein
MLYVSLAFGGKCLAAQEATQYAAPSAACVEFNRTALQQINSGQLAHAEAALSEALTKSKDFEQSCAWLVLHNMAVVAGLSGGLAEAEVLEERSLKILEKAYPPDDHVFFRPLQLLSSIRFEQRKIGKAREAFQRLRTVRTAGPEDRAMLHGLAAALLHTEGKYVEAEPEYLAALAAWDEAGAGDTADAVAVLNGLGTLYIDERRFPDAKRTLDRAITIAKSAKDIVPMDRIKLLHARALLHCRQGEWKEAEQDLRAAIEMSVSLARLDPVLLKSLLTNYAAMLRKVHRGKEARSIEARAATLQTDGLTNGIVDVSELLAQPKPGKK